LITLMSRMGLNIGKEIHKHKHVLSGITLWV
jgi:metal-dependent HD superfamily phosphatase/phosphodiesterase